MFLANLYRVFSQYQNTILSNGRPHPINKSLEYINFCYATEVKLDEVSWDI